ncbi:MAG: leucine-rich repeat domain-containing protein [Treponemataceae bacterium]|nr:leucine-rich repeat domain-containing protein [Treponemataceae bacterium]
MKKNWIAACMAAVCALALVTGCSSETDEPEGIEYDAGEWLIEGRTVLRYTGTGTDVKVPDGVTEIGRRAFASRTKVTHVTLPDSVAVIEDYAFSGCTGLADVNLPESVAMIGWYAFSGCKSLKSVAIPAKVTSIGEFAFWNCTSLESVTIPASVETIENYAFNGCSSLDTVTYQGTLAQWCALNGSDLVSYAERVTIGGENLKDKTELVIPGGVESIGSGAFRGCGNLTSVTIPAGVKTIGDSAFYECGGLTEVTIPEGVTEIGQQAFSSCGKLTTVAIPVSVESIGYDAFYCSSLTDVTYGGTQAQWDKIDKGWNIFPYSISTITGKDGEEINVGD